ncbi:MAG TPA: carbohydrate ABC transporter permease [Terriglobia bacterium]|nr:carbohydrate ABC transporter permease [Terriglobia bacterium]
MNGLSKIFIVLCCVAALAPVAWHAISSVKTPEELTAIPPTVLPHEATLDNYRALFARRPFFHYYLNSGAIALWSSLVAIMAASTAAYRLARMRGWGQSVIRSGLLAVAFFPPIVFLFPLYELVRAAGLVNHPWGLILPYSALNLPFAIWLLSGAFRQIPTELEEAAAVDGMTRFQTFRLVVLPLARPSLITAGLLVFIFSWNEFMLALTFMNIETRKTVTVGVATLSGAFSYVIPWGQIAAGVIASAIPLVLLVVFFQRKIVAGLTAGAVK